MRKKSPILFLDMREETSLSLPSLLFVILLWILEKIRTECLVSDTIVNPQFIIYQVLIIEKAWYLGKHVKKFFFFVLRISKDLAVFLE